MALTGFPSKVQVTLGQNFQSPGTGNGNDLEQGQTLVLTKASVGDVWYEDPNGGVSPDAQTNRIAWRPEARLSTTNTWVASIFLCKSASDSWYATGYTPSGAIDYRGGVTANFAMRMKCVGFPATYTFKKLWNVGSLATPTPSITIGENNYGFRAFANKQAPSCTVGDLNTYVNSLGGGAPVVANYNKTFSTIEEYVPSTLGPDKTTYRYG